MDSQAIAVQSVEGVAEGTSGGVKPASGCVVLLQNPSSQAQWGSRVTLWCQGPLPRPSSDIV